MAGSSVVRMGKRSIAVAAVGVRSGRPEVRPAAYLVVFCVLGVSFGGCAREGDDAVLSRSEVPGVPDDVGEMFEGVIAATSGVESAELSTSVELGAVRVEVEGALDADGVGQGSGEVERGDGVIALEFRSDGETAWLWSDAPALVGLLPEGVSWVEAPRDDLIDAGILRDLDATWDTLLFLRGIESIEDRGVESVEGEAVRVLHGSVDYELAYDLASPDEQAAMDEVLSFSEGFTRFDADVAIDSMGRVRTLDYDIGVGRQIDVSLPVALSFRVSSFDQAVEAPEPPDSDITVPVDEVPGALEALLEPNASPDFSFPIHDPSAVVENGFYPVLALAGVVGGANANDPCQGFDGLIGQHVAGADGQCYGLDLDAGLGIGVVESATVAGQGVALTFTAEGIDSFNQLAATCRGHSNPRCSVGKIAVVASGQVVSAPTVQEESFGRDAISITGDFTAEQLTAIADALSPD
jgi:hypothetical protein